jgi:RNA polymerase sigma-70 factor (ECF subfamily)
MTDARTAYRELAPALVRKAERILRNRDDAVDTVHALFVDLIPKWTADMDLPYLYRAVTNRCLNALRDEATRARLLAHQGAAAAPVARVRLDDEVVGLEVIAKLVGELDAGHLEVLVCRFVDDMTQDEIADHLGVSRKTVGKRLDRIREAVGLLRGAA